MLSVNIFWFRRDLRLSDNTGLFHALKAGLPVVPIFIFDKNILNKLEDKADRRVQFIYNALSEIQAQLATIGSSLEVYYGMPNDVFAELADKYILDTVFTNHDYEPYAVERDGQLKTILSEKGISFNTYKDHVLLEKTEVVKDDGKPYTVFTPYSRRWKSIITEEQLKA